MRIRILFLLVVTQAMLQVPVYRLVQYDYEGSPYGSQVSSFNFLGSTFNNEQEVPLKLTLICEASLTQDVLEATIALKPSAILIILKKITKISKEIQNYLGNNLFHFPIYFAEESDELMEVYSTLQSTGVQTIDSDQLQFSVSSDEKPAIKNLQQENFYGFIDEFSENQPTLAIVTYLDSFSIIPEMTTGADSNASGLIVLLELVRLLKKLYKTNPAGYNILFLISGSGTTNFQGLKNWLSAEDQELQQIRGSISFALCLDTLGTGENAYLHTTRFHKEGETDLSNLYLQFNLTAEKMKVPLNYIKKKVNMADPFTPWQHESFVKNKIVSATFSRLENIRTSVVDHGNVQDKDVELDTIVRNVKLIGESLVKHIYGKSEISLFDKGESLNVTFIEELVRKVSEFNRFPTKVTPGSAFSGFLQGVLKDIGVVFKQQKFPATEVTLYSTKAENLSVFKVKPAMLDFYLFLAILGYLVLVWGSVKVLSKSSNKKKRS